MTRQAILSAKGWKKKGIYDEPRLSELVETYEAIGFKVHLEPFDIFEEQTCTDCMKAAPLKYKTLYTKKKAAD